MPHSEDQVEQIVHAVLARLGNAASAASTPHGELVLNDNVVSAATLANRLDGIQRVVVTARAVVTPAARDILKEKNVTLVRTLQAKAAASVQLVLAHTEAKKGTNYDCTDLIRQLQQRGVEVEQLPTGQAGKVTHELAEAVSRGKKLGVLLTDQVAAALCAANRRRGVRAATAANRGEVYDVMQNLGVNLLVVDSVRRSGPEVQRIVEAFAATPSQACPAEWKPWLE
ncbi:MAG TPA: RpiB/LacA/LacB family sugar-phosphate isomerase [Pirellulales bacterium]|nr:RpiB/LacA/LacB family sugar-phosphate isomerase [Pirellulales bacterium]